MTTPTQAAAPVTPTPKNGATTPAQQPVVPPAQSAPPPDATQAELKTWQEKAQKAEAIAAQKTREEIVNRRKWETEKKTFGEKLKSADEYERLRRDAKVSPVRAVSALLGVPATKALELLNTVAANGDAPTAESVAQAFADQEAAMEAKFAKREEDAKAQRETQQREATEKDFGTLSVEAEGFVKALLEDYPAFKKMGDAKFVGSLLAQRIQATPAFARYRGALQYADAETRVAIMKQAAEGLEAQALSLGMGLVEFDKYKGKFQEKLTPAKPAGTVPPVVKSSQASSQGSSQSSQPRRTLGNDLTGSTPGDAPKFRTEEERIKAARAVGQALLNQQR